ncbi:MAG: hypothetical protein DRQ55_16535 [Planctomycetota bacterium]|nr:MAG: hypothetical protein DRQ55_16535 [Planctomycetota bacterium]RLA43824.1 MAG: hypothetical protein DRQ97_12285 [Gammaproteobacteria bacterium]
MTATIIGIIMALRIALGIAVPEKPTLPIPPRNTTPTIEHEIVTVTREFPGGQETFLLTQGEAARYLSVHPDARVTA